MAERKTSRRWRLLLAVVATTVLGTVVALSGCTTLDRWGADTHEVARDTALKTASPQWHEDHFENPQPMLNDTAGALLGLFQSAPNTSPEAAVPVLNSEGQALATPPASGLRLTWFGHSSSLVEVDGARVLIDPIWSHRPSPFTWIGPQRWFAPPIALARLPAIDAVLVSHDHYDHFDAATIQALAQRGTPRFIVPLGIGLRLRLWGVPADRITELDWWQATDVGALKITATPARHASGRLNPRSNHTLWAGYAMVGPQHRVYYSGDTGLFDALTEIGDRLGPFDLTLIESGQYDAAWPDWHLGPEQAVQAHQRVRGKVMVPVHWGLFQLAHHGWTEPVERVLAAARCTGTTVLTPQPGQSVEPAQKAQLPHWWPDVPWSDASQKPIVATRAGKGEDRVTPLDCAPR